MAVLRGWLSHFLREDAPASLRRAPSRPPRSTAFFSPVLEEHAELVVQLQLLKRRADQIEDGDMDGGDEIEDWFAFLDDRPLPLVRLIGRICRHGHLDVTAPRHRAEVSIAPCPFPVRRLPVRRPDRRSAPPWSAYLSGPSSGLDR